MEGLIQASHFTRLGITSPNPWHLISPTAERPEAYGNHIEAGRLRIDGQRYLSVIPEASREIGPPADIASLQPQDFH